MKTHTRLVILALLALAFTGCSTHTQRASLPKNSDLGDIDVSSGKPSSHTLADGRASTITTAVLPDGNVSLTTRVDEKIGFKTLTFEAPADGRAVTFGLDES